MRRAQAIAHKFQLTLISIVAVAVVIGVTVFLLRRRKARLAAVQAKTAPVLGANPTPPQLDPAATRAPVRVPSSTP